MKKLEEFLNLMEKNGFQRNDRNMAFTLLEEEPAPIEKKEGFFPGLAQTVASGAAKIGTTAIGLPGDILSLTNLVAAPLSKAITGKEPLPFEETIPGKIFPTSSGLEKELHAAMPYLKPKNDFQKFGNDVVGTITSLLTPAGQSKVGMFMKTSPIVRATIKGIGAQLVGKGIENLSGDEKKGAYASSGALFAMSLLDKQGAAKYISNIFQKAEDALTKSGNPIVNASRLRNSLENTKQRLSRGTLSQTESAVVQDIDRALGHFKQDDIPVENLWGITRSLNERRNDAVRAAGANTDRLRARKFYDGIIREVNQELESYGKTNPGFGKPFKEAQTGFGAIARSNVITNWIEKNFGRTMSPQLMHLFGGVGAAGAAKLGSLFSPQGAAVGAGYQSAKILYRVMQSPALRRYYLQSLGEAAKESAQGFSKNIQKLDKGLEKEEVTKQKYTLLD